MMTAVFGAMLLALAAAWLGKPKAAVTILGVCLVLLIWLFLFEIYSPDYGFRMPWIQTERGVTAHGTLA